MKHVLKAETGRYRPVFNLVVVPKEELKRFDLQFGGTGIEVREVKIKEGETVIFEKKVSSVNGRIKFNVDKKLLKVGTKYVLQIQ